MITIKEITKVITKNNKAVRYEVVDCDGSKSLLGKDEIICAERIYQRNGYGVHFGNTTITSNNHIIVPKRVERIDFKNYYLCKYIAFGQFLALLLEEGDKVEKMSLDEKIEYGFKKWFLEIENIEVGANEVLYDF